MDEKIESSEKELEELTQKVDKLKTSMQEIETKLEEETQKYETQKALFEERMVAIYEAGQTQYLDILLNSTNVSDFLSSYYVMSEIAENDAELLNNLGEKKDEIALAKQKLENERDELATIVENQTRIEKVLKNTKLIRETFIAKLSEEEKNEVRRGAELYKKYGDVFVNGEYYRLRSPFEENCSAWCAVSAGCMEFIWLLAVQELALLAFWRVPCPEKCFRALTA